MRTRAGLYNAVPNFFWTGVFVTPAAYYFYQYLPLYVLWLMPAVCLIVLFFPNSFFDRIQLSQNSLFYRRLGIRYVNLLAQNGRLLNKLIQNQYPGYRNMSITRRSIRKQYAQTYFFEKFHFSFFLIFLGLSVFAIIQSHYYWALVITVSNAFYNIYPNLLQQYIRVKLGSAIDTR